MPRLLAPGTVGWEDAGVGLRLTLSVGSWGLNVGLWSQGVTLARALPLTSCVKTWAGY